MHVSGANASAAQVSQLNSKNVPPPELQQQQNKVEAAKSAEVKAQSLPQEEGKGQFLDIRV